MAVSNGEFLAWIHDRLGWIHHEKTSVDYMIRLRKIIEEMRAAEKAPTAVRRPQPTHVCDHEGDGFNVSWIEWQKLRVSDVRGKLAHAIKFDDGTVFDMSNGWREKTPKGWRRIEDSRIDGTGWAEAAFSDDVDPAQRELVHA